MKLFILFVLFATSSSVEIETEDEVLVLTKDNFDQAIRENDHILVEFYAPWCGHCKKLTPEYAQAAKTLKDEGSKIKLAKVDATIERDLGDKFGVRGYPTLQFFTKGEPSKYDGNRKAEGIVEWVKKASGLPTESVEATEEKAEAAKDEKVADTDDKKADSDPAKIETEDDVLVLTESNFDQAIKENEFILVEFYAPWCGHCKKLAPEYAKAAKTLLEGNQKPKLAKVDATEQKELGAKFGVRGYPTIKFFVNGEPSDYSGPRDAEGIVQWLKKKSGPPAIDVKTLAAFQELKESNNVLVLGCFSNQDSAKAKAFMDAAKKIDDFEVAITSVKDVIAENVAQDETIVLFKNFDDPKTEFAGEFNAEEIKQWVDDNSVPLVWEFSQATAQKIFKGAAKVHYIYFEENKENFATVKEALKSAAVEYKGKVAFVVVDASDAPNANVLQFFGVKKDQLPMAAIFEMDSNSKYLREANQAADSKEVLETMKKYFNGEIEKTMKTEEIPEDWDKEPVKVLVGKNFNQVALDKSKDVFVEFYAPWCGHCKSLAPVWEELAKEFDADDSILIAKVDATANECEGVNIKSFPTLKLWKKESNQVVDFNGARDLETLKHFVKTGEMSLPKKSEDEEVEKKDEEEKKKDEL